MKRSEQNDAVVNHDMVNHPSHYNENGIECIEVMKIIFGITAVKWFCRLNAFKYIWRSNRKGKDLEDLKKAQWYLSYLIKLTENETNSNLERSSL